jgi:TPR repeat protein
MINYSNAFLMGLGVKKNERKALEWLEKAADMKHPIAQNNLATFYYEGIIVEKDLTKAFELFQRSAEEGYVSAINNLGICYEEGKGTVRDIEKATALYLKASKLGSIEAMNNLGYLKLAYGDIDFAKSLFRQAAKLGSSEALYNLGKMYENSLGVKQSFEKAFKYYLKAADKGHAKAQRHVGDILYSGTETIAQDKELAIKYYLLSASQGDAASKNNLGIIYEEGLGTECDYEKAASWYREASFLNYSDAFYNLALMIETGKILVDKNESYILYQKAAQLDHQEAKERLKLFNKENVIISDPDNFEA